MDMSEGLVVVFTAGVYSKLLFLDITSWILAWIRASALKELLNDTRYNRIEVGPQGAIFLPPVHWPHRTPRGHGVKLNKNRLRRIGKQ